MKTKILFLTMFLAVATFGYSKTIKGNGNVITCTYTVADYHSIDATVHSDGGFSIFNFNFDSGNSCKKTFTYSQSNKVTLSITSDKNLFEYIKVYSKNGALTIKTKKNYTISPTRFDIKGSSTELKEVNCSGSTQFIAATHINSSALNAHIGGSGSIQFNHGIKTGKFYAAISGSGSISAKGITCTSAEAHISGSGNVNIQNINTPTIETSVSGSGDMLITGTAVKAAYSISGSGTVKAEALKTSDAKCHVSGSGDIYLYATNTLNSSCSGSGNVYYKGTPKINSSNSGSSKLKSIE